MQETQCRMLNLEMTSETNLAAVEAQNLVKETLQSREMAQGEEELHQLQEEVAVGQNKWDPILG